MSAAPEPTFIFNFRDLDDYCANLVAKLGSKAILLLDGPLGVGKTKTVEHLVKQLGVVHVASPTFALHHRYEIAPAAKPLDADKIERRPLHVDHFDLYRIESESDLESTGFWDVFRADRAWVVIEWPDRVAKSHLPRGWQLVEIQIALSDERAKTSGEQAKTLGERAARCYQTTITQL